MKMYEQPSRIVVGALLKRARFENGSIQREIAIDLGLPNPNFLSMIESGRHSVPAKRLIDVGKAYCLKKFEILAIVKLTSPDLWETVLECTRQIGLTQDGCKDLNAKVDDVIEAITCDPDIKIV